MVKGQKEQIFVREVTQADRDRFPRAYAAFKAGVEAPVTGTLIDLLPGLGPSMAMNFKASGVRTVEDLAALDDQAIGKMGTGARELRARAKAMVSQTSESTIKLEQELSAERDARKALEEQMRAMQEQLAALTAPPKKLGLPNKDKGLQ